MSSMMSNWARILVIASTLVVGSTAAVAGCHADKCVDNSYSLANFVLLTTLLLE